MQHSETGRPQGVLPSQSGWYWCVLGEGEAGLAVAVSDPEDSSLVLPVVPPQPSPSPRSATTTYARVMSTTVPITTTKLGRAGRKRKMNMMQKSEVVMLKDVIKKINTSFQN